MGKSRGVRGGAVVFHPVRLNSPRWGGKGCPHSGPHFHVLGDSWLDHGAVARLHAKDGWVVKGLKARGSIEAARKTAHYLLSHAGQAAVLSAGNPAEEEPTRPRTPLETVTWFGTLSYNRLKVHVDRPEGVLCKVCERLVPLREWVEVHWRGKGPPPEGSGVCDPSEWRAEVHDQTDRSYELVRGPNPNGDPRAPLVSRKAGRSVEVFL